MLCNILLSNISHFLVSAYRFTSFKHLYNNLFYECSIIGHSLVLFFCSLLWKCSSTHNRRGNNISIIQLQLFFTSWQLCFVHQLPPSHQFFFFFPWNILKQILFVYITSHISICVSHKSSSCNIITMPLSNLDYE